jgi:hypothetical protein
MKQEKEDKQELKTDTYEYPGQCTLLLLKQDSSHFQDNNQYLMQDHLRNDDFNSDFLIRKDSMSQFAENQDQW